MDEVNLNLTLTLIVCKDNHVDEVNALHKKYQPQIDLLRVELLAAKKMVLNQGYLDVKWYKTGIKLVQKWYKNGTKPRLSECKMV